MLTGRAAFEFRNASAASTLRLKRSRFKLPSTAYPSARFSVLVQLPMSTSSPAVNSGRSRVLNFATISTKTVYNFVDNSSPIRRMPATGLPSSELPVFRATFSSAELSVTAMLPNADVLIPSTTSAGEIATLTWLGMICSLENLLEM